MDWNEVASWVFGFLTPLIVPGTIIGGFSLLGSWFSLPDTHHLDLSAAFTGGALCVGLFIIGAALAAHYL